ncbi:hypothetical protein KOM00_05925 [Geomonas sp. Red69]|uniref:hypothetical protein n=1 Tax=Geomonas diazotrophica TaxID=2843197 RepID=UPI001C107CA6|nr:hypothetical protein [Geomonas diazotrophica]MBU5636267.1 hypothetical protein [Geomonas diazotrophica]
MRKVASLVAVALITVNTSALADEKKNNFNYSSQIGIAEVTPTSGGCLTIRNPYIRENQKIKLVIAGNQQKVVEKKILKKLKASCSRNPDPPAGASFYSFPAAEGEYFEPSIAVVGFSDGFKIVKDKVRVDLDGDGAAESFRSCTSNEGLHLTVWAGEDLKSKRQWHEYYYLGYDVVPSCKPADYKE